MTTETIHEKVRARYAAAATQAGDGSCCSGTSDTIGAELYSALDRADLPESPFSASLGCGCESDRRAVVTLSTIPSLLWSDSNRCSIWASNSNSCSNSSRAKLSLFEHEPIEGCARLCQDLNSHSTSRLAVFSARITMMTPSATRCTEVVSDKPRAGGGVSRMTR